MVGSVNIDGWEHFSLTHPFLVKMFEVILLWKMIFLYTKMDSHQRKTKCT